MQYAVEKDENSNGLVIFFGTEEEIAEGILCGAYMNEDNGYEKFQKLQAELQDSGELCEDYLIESERFTEESQIPELKVIVEAQGFVENVGLLNCKWG